MKLACKRCNHRWKTRADKHPSICPRCKSKKWEEPLGTNEVSDLLNERCQAIVQMAGNVDYCTMAPQLLLTVMVAFAEAEKVAADRPLTVENASVALRHFDVIKQLAAEKVIPEEMYRVCWRLGESYFKDAMLIEKDTNPTESEYKHQIVNNWSDSPLADLKLVGVEVALPDLDRIDILAKDDNGRDVIIELKKGSKDGYRQLRAYGFFYDNPRLINISEKAVERPKKGIEYRIF